MIEESYWFIRFSVFINTTSGSLQEEVRGNSVHTLKSKSFLPRVVSDSLMDYYKIWMSEKGQVVKDISCHIDFVLEIDRDGVTDFDGNRIPCGSLGSYSIMSTYYSKQITLA